MMTTTMASGANYNMSHQQQHQHQQYHNQQHMNNDPRLFYDLHDHQHTQHQQPHSGQYLDESQGFHVGAAASAGHHQNAHMDEQQLLHANMNANMMRFMRNTNSNKVYQKIVRKFIR